MITLRALCGAKVHFRPEGPPRLLRHSRGCDEPWHDPFYYDAWTVGRVDWRGLRFKNELGEISEWYMTWCGAVWRPVTSSMQPTFWRRVHCSVHVIGVCTDSKENAQKDKTPKTPPHPEWLPADLYQSKHMPS